MQEEPYLLKETCIGCQYNAPGQKRHMEKGGCLYMESDDESDSQKTIADPELIAQDNDV